MPEQIQEPETVTEIDRGNVCVHSMGTDLFVEVNRCVMDSCQRLIGNACTVSILGGIIRVHSETRLERGGDCSGTCQFVVSRCTLSDVEPGSYPLRFGFSVGELPVPTPQGWMLETGSEPVGGCQAPSQGDAGL